MIFIPKILRKSRTQIMFSFDTHCSEFEPTASTPVSALKDQLDQHKIRAQGRACLGETQEPPWRNRHAA